MNASEHNLIRQNAQNLLFVVGLIILSQKRLGGILA